MKTIIIDEKTVSIDGVIFERKVPEFKVGQWVYIPNPYNARVKRIKSIDKFGQFPIEFEESGAWENGNGLRPATHSEIEEHLDKVRIEKGYKEGIKIIGLTYDGTPQLRSDSCSNRFNYDKHDDSLDSNGLRVYCKGKWADIVPDKKKLPVTKEEFEEFLFEYVDSPHFVKTFLNDYE